MAYQRLNASDANALTLKAVMKELLPVANNWFGGSISPVCQAISLKSPATQMSMGSTGFNWNEISKKAFDALRSKLQIDADVVKSYELDYEALSEGSYYDDRAENLAKGTIKFVQMKLALGKSPTRSQFGYKGSLESYAEAAGMSVVEAWKFFSSIMEDLSPAPDHSQAKRACKEDCVTGYFL